MFKPEDFGPINLSAGSHSDPSDGMCVMEMVSFLAGEKWSDRPACSSPAIARFAQVANDRMDQEGRDKLQRYIPMLIGTASPDHEKARCEFLVWQAIRVFAPIALDVAGLAKHAKRLREYEGGFSGAAEICREARAAAAAAARWADATDARWAAVAAAVAADAVAAATDARWADARWAAAAAAAAAAVAAALWAADAAADADADAAADAVAAAAAVADDAAKDKLSQAFFDTLDGLIGLGPSGSMEPIHIERIPKLHKALTTA